MQSQSTPERIGQLPNVGSRSSGRSKRSVCERVSTRARCLALTSGLLLSGSVLPLAAQTAPPEGVATTAATTSTSPRIPLSANFSTPEQVGTWASVGVALSLYLFDDSIYDALHPTHDSLIPTPFAWEVAVSDALYQGPEYHFLGGVPDIFGEKVAPFAVLGFYGADALTQKVRGAGFTGNLNADHSFMAFAQAYSVNLAATQLTKVVVGRERPYFALNRNPGGPRDNDSYMSFFSGHSSSSFCLAAFVTRDITDALVSGPLASAPSTSKLWLGRIAPGAALYGTAALIAFSRVIDQQHYVTDVLVGSAVGALVGNAFYALHFDAAGQPRQRFPSTQARLGVLQQVSATVTPGETTPFYVSVSGAF